MKIDVTSLFHLSPTVSFFSADIIKEDDKIISDDPQASPDFLALINPNGMPPHHLQLKEGCICSLMQNMSIQKGLVKNAWLIVDHLHRRFLQVRVIDNRTGLLGPSQCIPRICFKFTPDYSSWTIHRLQFPV